MAANRQQRADCHAATLQCIADIWYIYNNNSFIARFDGYPVHCLSGLPVFAVNKRGPYGLRRLFIQHRNGGGTEGYCKEGTF